MPSTHATWMSPASMRSATAPIKPKSSFSKKWPKEVGNQIIGLPAPPNQSRSMRRPSEGEYQVKNSRFIRVLHRFGGHVPADQRGIIPPLPGRSAAVAYLLWEQMVAGSIPAAPTTLPRYQRQRQRGVTARRIATTASCWRPWQGLLAP